MPVKTPLLSVVMPVYNGERYLKTAITSILNQTLQDFELIILDDGSTDRSADIIQSFSDNRIRFIPAVRNSGLIATLNKGLELSTGTFIARMDQDDISFPQRMEKEVQILQTHPDIAFVATRIMLVDEQGAEKGFWNEDRMVISTEQIRQRMPQENCIAHPTIMARSEVIKKFGYAPSQQGSEDWDLWLRMLSAGEQVYKINEVLLQYRIHEQSMTVKRNKKSVYLKRSQIQLRYAINQISRFRFNAFDRKVLVNGFLNLLKHLLALIHPSVFTGIKQIAGIHLLDIYIQLRELRKLTRKAAKDNTNLFFFFPFYHTGGAEKVHAEILEAVSDQQPVVFITGVSAGKGFYDLFRKQASLIDISLISSYPLIHKQVSKRIARLINSAEDARIFGCNTQFYYSLLNHISEQVICTDLTHAFVHPGEQGPELWSLPVVHKLQHRVVITQRLFEDFRKLYAQHGVDAALTERIQYISNYTEIPKTIQKSVQEPLNVLYVGRSSYEKRVHLVGQIARKVAEQGVKVSFVLAGDMQQAINEEDRIFCTLTGEVTDSNTLNNLYNRADLLLITSSREGFPLVIMEAMAHGAVPVSTDVGGIAEHVIPGQTGVLVPSLSEESIVASFVQAIVQFAGDRPRLQKYSENCFAYAGKHFNKEHFVKAYRNLLINKEA